ncbi:hypothetical protein F4009_01325 [Candidatus Poribacteria bacterium]|nr:hypothetical protein [Candidatus Poribacteria bacterium]MYA70245.1 hypothetical protein [Candidatus Poribacteria bacterium]MYH81518.1 hypothetical protein [Candidatus Poribacteria bacterium]MYK92640.1 hypothetical protein [Candidatus Poribacteria bacterium]
MMGGPGLAELIALIVLYPLAAIFGAVMIGIGIALGFRWGSKWLWKAIYNDPEFEKWLKRALNASEKPDQ